MNRTLRRLAFVAALPMVTACTTVPNNGESIGEMKSPVCDASPRAASYLEQFTSMVLRDEAVAHGKSGETWTDRRSQLIAEIKANQVRYQSVASRTNTPWEVVAVLHAMESTLNFNANLLNGESYKQVTELVPKGRGPWATWEDAAVDGINEIWERRLASQIDLARPEVLACVFELYNGAGYIRKGKPSPYLWSGTHHYEKGKFVERRFFVWFGPTYVDYDPELRSGQLGAMPLLAALTR